MYLQRELHHRWFNWAVIYGFVYGAIALAALSALVPGLLWPPAGWALVLIAGAMGCWPIHEYRWALASYLLSLAAMGMATALTRWPDLVELLIRPDLAPEAMRYATFAFIAFTIILATVEERAMILKESANAPEQFGLS
jgi:hypothetical protein